jgi:OmpA-OmpF porin, OOP family
MKLKFTIASLFFLVHLLTAQPLNENPFAALNSPYDEQHPVLSPDGKTIFFTIANHPGNTGGKKDPGDIWYCRLEENNQWSAPVHGGSMLNNSGFNGVAGFSGDGRQMYLLSHYDPTGHPARTQGISISVKNGSQWSRPENITIPYFQNKSNLISGFISNDNQYFVFSAEAYGSYGVEDLFVCIRKPDGKWSEPRNLGAGINTRLQELSPSLSADNKTLYFSTNGRKGKGSFDIYSSTRLDDTWLNWSEPANMESVNTHGRDLYYREYPTLGFSVYTSTINSDGYGDVKQFTPETPFPMDTTAVVSNVSRPVPVLREQTNVPVTRTDALLVRGTVTNSKTGEPVVARLSFEQASTVNMKMVQSSALGYSLELASQAQYHVRIEAEGFISAMEKLDVRSLEARDLELNFTLQPIEVGTTVNLKDVLFAQSKTDLLPESFRELDLVVEFLRNNPTVRIELSGHTDNRGVPFQNLKLSQGRVDRVRDYLISKGIDGKRITGKGYGGTKPIADNNDDEARPLNRRVEFTIMKN